jgi:hypothetical protein
MSLEHVERAVLAVRANSGRQLVIPSHPGETFGIVFQPRARQMEFGFRPADFPQ